jgi:hypothetical protein
MRYMDSKSKFTELIAVRFTKEELARLQEAADDQSIGASTLVRILVNQALRPDSAKPRRMTSEEFNEVMVSTLARLDKGKVDSFFKEVAVGSADDPVLLMWAGQTKEWEEFTSLFLKALLAALGIDISFPENRQLVRVNNRSTHQIEEGQEVKSSILNSEEVTKGS